MNRVEFKKVKVQSRFFLYPTPVQKEKKYLIVVDEHWGELAQWMIYFKVMVSPDTSPDYLQLQPEKHTDGITRIFSINWSLIDIDLLPNRHLDSDKATKIEKVLESKLLSFVSNGSQQSWEDLLRAWDKQMKCQTCQRLGITDSKMNLVFNKIDLGFLK
jgi:hypothetical protein